MFSLLSRISLLSLRHLETVVRLGTFEAAAEEMGVTTGAVSQQIRKLEAGLEIELFHRYGNRTVPTQEAREIAETLGRAFGEIESTLSEHGARGVLDTSVKIVLYQTWANRWLIPRLDKFAQQHPEISVEFETGLGRPGSGWGSLDMAINQEDEAREDIIRLPLITPRLGPVCTPDLAQRIERTEDLLNLPRIASRNRMDDWPRWLSSAGVMAEDKKPLMVFSNSTLVYEAALAGHGVAIAQLELVLNELVSGRLVRPLKPVVESTGTISIHQPRSRARRSASRLFRDWLVEEAALLRQRAETVLRSD